MELDAVRALLYQEMARNFVAQNLGLPRSY